MAANGSFGASVITAVTAQNTMSVATVHEVPGDIVAAQIDAVLSDIWVQAIKLGMLFSASIIDVVARGIADFDGPVVVDPVMIAKSGDTLLQDAAVDAMKDRILPRATLLTPNLPEAARLLGEPLAATSVAMTAQGMRLLDMGPQAVLMKGGHSDGETCTDILIDAGGVVATLDAGRIPTRNTHGTGCTYSAAIAAQLSKGQGLRASVAAAHRYLQGAIAAADQLMIGRGYGPVHHFHGQW